MDNFAGSAFFIVLLAAWFTHVITCFNEGWWGYLIAGAVFAPVAVVHGIYIWIQALFG